MTVSLVPARTQRLILRSFAPQDLDDLSRYLVLPEMQRYLDRPVREREDCEGALSDMLRQVSLNRPGETLTLAVVRHSDLRLIGHLSLRWADATAAQGELKFMLDPRQRGHGYAREAVGRLIDFAFDDFGIHRVFARCDARNSRAVKLMQALGMRLEAHYREHALFQGEWDEELHFAVLDREWHRSSKVKELTHRVA